MVKLEYQKQSICNVGRGLPTGVVFFDFGTFQFPESDWNDSIVVVMGWWLTELLELLTGRATSVNLRFMEGAFSLRISGQPHKMLRLECLEGRQERIALEFDCTAGEFARSVVHAATSLQTICHEMGWTSSDVAVLDDKLPTAKALVADLS